MSTKEFNVFAESGLFDHVYSAQEDPLNPGNFISPILSTDISLPILSDNECAVFDLTSNIWVITPDFRGEVWYDKVTGESVLIENFGQPASNLTKIQPPPKPQDPSTLILTPRQIRLVLNAANLRNVVENAVALEDQNTKDMWQFSSLFFRNDPLLNAMAIKLGIASTQLDSLFEQGQSL